MSLYNGPPRPGARGGRAEFSWENVKADKDREYYLGHSVKATTGRWAKGKDVFWYNKEKQEAGVSRDEIAAVKAREAEMMAEALGLKPKAAPKTLKQPALEKHEVDKLLKGAGDEQQAAALEGERIKGLGFGSGTAVAVREEVHDVLQGTGVPPAGRVGPPGGGTDGMMTAEQLAALDAADRKGARKADKKAKKEAKKAKKGKKEHKEKHKRKRKKHKHRSTRSTSSRSSSSSSDSEDKPTQHSTQLRRPTEQQELGRHGRGQQHQHSDDGRLHQNDRHWMHERHHDDRSIEQVRASHRGREHHQPHRSSVRRSRSRSRSPARRHETGRSRSPAAWRERQQEQPPQQDASERSRERGNGRDDRHHYAASSEYHRGRRNSSRDRGRSRSYSRDRLRK